MRGNSETCLGFCLLIYTISLLPKAATTCSKGCCCHTGNWINCSDESLDRVPQPPANGKPSVDWCNSRKNSSGYPDWGNNGPDAVTTMKLGSSSFSRINTEIFKDFRNIESINCDGCVFKKLEQNAFWLNGSESHLKSISLRQNAISEIHPKAFDGLTKLETLDMTGNKMRILPDEVFDPLGELTHLYLSDNLVEELNPRWFKELYKLQVLRVESNKLTSIPEMPTSLFSMTELNVKGNQIEAISSNSFKNLGNLGKLDLSKNFLEIVDPFVFQENTRLYYVDLSHNQLKQLDKCIFVHLESLRYIDVSYNKLTTAHYEWFAKSVHNCDKDKNCDKSIFLPVTKGNPWICDCNMDEFAVFLLQLYDEYQLKDEKWGKYLHIDCSGDGLIDEDKLPPRPGNTREPGNATTNATIIPQCFTGHSAGDELFENKANMTCAPKQGGDQLSPDSASTPAEIHPLCAFLKTDHCPKPPETVPMPVTAAKATFLAIIAAAIIVVVGLAFIFRQKRREKRRHSSESSSEGASVSESEYSTGSQYSEESEMLNGDPRPRPLGSSECDSNTGTSLQASITTSSSADNTSNTFPETTTDPINSSTARHTASRNRSLTVPKTVGSSSKETSPKVLYTPGETGISVDPLKNQPKPALSGNQSFTVPKTVESSSSETIPKEHYSSEETIPKRLVATRTTRQNQYVPPPSRHPPKSPDRPNMNAESEYTPMRPLIPVPDQVQVGAPTPNQQQIQTQLRPALPPPNCQPAQLPNFHTPNPACHQQCHGLPMLVLGYIPTGAIPNMLATGPSEMCPHNGGNPGFMPPHWGITQAPFWNGEASEETNLVQNGSAKHGKHARPKSDEFPLLDEDDNPKPRKRDKKKRKK